MPDTLPINSMPSVFSPLAKALLDGFSEGVVVFDAEGRLLYTNQPAREAMAGMDLFEGAPDLQPRLAALGGRLRPLRVGGLELGEAMFIPGVAGATTLAAREKEAIVKTLDAHSWKLAETARSLGISRTTLWRRLKAYGLHREAGVNGRKPPNRSRHHSPPIAPARHHNNSITHGFAFERLADLLQYNRVQGLSFGVGYRVSFPAAQPAALWDAALRAER